MTTEKKFRFQNSRALLTYKTHLVKEDYIKWFEEKVNQTPKFIRLCHEFGENKGTEEAYEHTHVVFKLQSTFQTTNERFFDYNNLHPNIKFLSTEKAFGDAKKYIAKEDPANVDLLTPDVSIAEKVWKKDNIQDALKMCTTASEAMGIIALFNAKKNTVEIEDEDLPKQDWQKEFLTERKEKPNAQQKRQITWYCDKAGNTGKTQLARYLMITESEKWLICKDMGTSRDSSTVITNALASGWTGHGIILDLPRQAQNHNRMYQYIEEIKDGFITSQKYNGKTSVFNKPHFIVFANWMPKCWNLSRDRWDIRLMKKNKKGVVSIEKYTPSEEELTPPNENNNLLFDIDSE